MEFKQYRKLVQSDLYRYLGDSDPGKFIAGLLKIPGFKYTFWMRTAAFFRSGIFIKWPFHIIARIMLNHYQYRYGISIPYNTNIGSGFYIGHFGGIILNDKVIIGKNCNLNHNVTIGETFGGKRPGVPQIGDNVYIGPGSIIMGGIKIGNNVAIGAHSVVTKDIPDSGVVVGNPGKIISQDGSGNYVVNTDYD